MIVPTGLPNPRDLLVGKPLDFSKFHDFAEDVWKAPDGLSHLFDGDPAQESIFRVERNGIEQHLFREILALAVIPPPLIFYGADAQPASPVYLGVFHDLEHPDLEVEVVLERAE